MTDFERPFLEAANRLERVVKAVKDGQFAATGAKRGQTDAMEVLHPQEAWARRFATHAIRPVKDLAVGPPPLSAFVAPVAEIPAPRPVAEAPRTIAGSDRPAGGHIGSGLGKAGPRRSWVARLFGGR